MRSIYVCPQTKEPLSEGEGGLARGDGVRYEFIRGWGDAPIPDFLNAYELGDAGRKSLDMYNQAASVAVYRNFLDWLFETFGESEPDFRRRLVRRLNLKQGDRVLVTGCGLGDDVPPALEAVGDGGEVYAQDLSSEMVVAASAYVLRERPAAGVFFSVSNATLLPFADDFFDGAFHFGGINLFDDVGAAVREMARVVRPGGRVVFGDEGVAPWLRETDYGRAAITNNSLWGASAPVGLLPANALDVSLSWVLGNCFYVIGFEVSEGGPYMNMDVPHKGRRGGTMRTRYFGQLEGVTEESKRFVLEDAGRMGVSVHDWLEQVIGERRGR
jgi:SAM-dependent methyltransferase